MRILMFASLLIGCGDVVPNKAPDLLTINGIEVKSKRFDLGLGQGLSVTPGERLDLSLEVRDRQGHDVKVWFVAPPPGLEFDPDGLTGHWDVPAEDDLFEIYYSLDIALQDDAKDSRSQTYEVPLFWVGLFGE
ncbi:MAG: hypothetical protein AB8H79_12965 [Myxococcota bacterium]